ncbi:MAG: pentapeptide repeat-containing protein [Anaerolineales bacterium]|nr:pentapeptide repeat-containing protein [Anaerolineales bacterium]
MGTQAHPKETIRTQGYKFWRRFAEWWTIPRLIASLLLAFGLLGSLASNNILFSTPVLGSFLSDMSPEFTGIGITILIIDAASELLVTQQEKKRLVLQMGSPNNAFAVEAARQLKAQDWGYNKDRTLHQAHLAHADLSRGDLNDVNLQQANLSSALLRETRLNRANLQQADLSQARLIGAELNGASLVEANLNNALLNNATLVGADLRHASLVQANLRSQQHWAEHLTSEFKRSGCQPADDSPQWIETGSGRYTDLSQVNLHGADLRGADLHAVNLANADLSEANLNGADLSATRLNGAKLVLANLENANLSEADLTGANLDGADLGHTNLNCANILAEQIAQANSVQGAILPPAAKSTKP